MWPNLAGFELAPTTAKNFDEKKARAVASVDMSGSNTVISNCEMNNRKW